MFLPENGGGTLCTKALTTLFLVYSAAGQGPKLKENPAEGFDWMPDKKNNLQMIVKIELYKIVENWKTLDMHGVKLMIGLGDGHFENITMKPEEISSQGVFQYTIATIATIATMPCQARRNWGFCERQMGHI
jgi:hypothetical protein